MVGFTDFIIELKNGEEIEFRHTAQSVRELFSMDGDIILDIYESQCVWREDIRYIRLDPRPYVASYVSRFGHGHRNLTDLWDWVRSLGEDERDKIRRKHYEIQAERSW